MDNYTTQMDAARKGIITPQMEIVAKKKNIWLSRRFGNLLQKDRLQSAPIKSTPV